MKDGNRTVRRIEWYSLKKPSAWCVLALKGNEVAWEVHVD
jgi:hypothetical protein